MNETMQLMKHPAGGKAAVRLGVLSHVSDSQQLHNAAKSLTCSWS